MKIDIIIFVSYMCALCGNWDILNMTFKIRE